MTYRQIPVVASFSAIVDGQEYTVVDPVASFEHVNGLLVHLDLDVCPPERSYVLYRESQTTPRYHHHAMTPYWPAQIHALVAELPGPHRPVEEIRKRAEEIRLRDETYQKMLEAFGSVRDSDYWRAVEALEPAEIKARKVDDGDAKVFDRCLSKVEVERDYWRERVEDAERRKETSREAAMYAAQRSRENDQRAREAEHRAENAEAAVRFEAEKVEQWRKNAEYWRRRSGENKERRKRAQRGLRSWKKAAQDAIERVKQLRQLQRRQAKLIERYQARNRELESEVLAARRKVPCVCVRSLP